MTDERPLVLDERHLGRNIFQLALPAILENLSHSVLFLVDFMMIGWLGSIPAMAAVGTCGQIYFIFFMLFMPLSIGVTALVARKVGSGDFEGARRVAGQGVLIAFGVGIPIAAGVFAFVPKILDAWNLDWETKVIGISYMRPIAAVMFFDFLWMVASGAIRGAGNTRTPMIIVAVTNLVNIALAWMLIFGHGPFPAMGVMGSAIAAMISIVLGGALMASALFTKYSIFRMYLRNLRRFSWKITRSIFEIALPSLVEQFFLVAGIWAFWKMVTGLGDISVAAHTIAGRIESFSFLPGLGFAVAASTLSGQSLGAGNAPLTEQSMRRTAYFAALLMSIMGVGLAVFPAFVASLFDPAPPVKTLAVGCLIIGAAEQIPLALFFSLSGGLRGAGDTLSAMTATFVGMVVVRIPLALLFAFGLGWGVLGLWAAGVIDWIVRAVIADNRIRSGAWKQRTPPGKWSDAAQGVMELPSREAVMPDEI